MKLDTQTLVDLALDHRIAPSRYFFEWEEFARWSFDSLRACGLEPHHRLLDVGCGAMRAGIEFLPFLEPDRYFGLDAYEPYLRLANRIVEVLQLPSHDRLVHSQSFDFDSFGVEFDIALCQSVFTHLSHEEVERCIANLRKVMRPGGRLLFTHNTRRAARGDLYDQRQPMIHSGQSVEWLGERAKKNGLSFETQPVEHPTQHTGLLGF